MFKKIILIVFLFTTLINAQEYYVEYQKIEGTLSEQDLFKPNFGRYDGFKLPLNKSERTHFIVYSEEFSPSLVLVTPEDKKFQQVSARGEDFVSMGLKVPEAGEWVLYVIGDSSASGKYLLQYAFADSASMSINPKTEFCSGLKYLLAHANAYFIFPQTVATKQPLYKLEGSVDAYINGDDASYNSTYYEGNSLQQANKIFNDISKKVRSCISNDWKHVKNKEEEMLEGVEAYQIWTEKKKENPRTIRITLFNNNTLNDGVEYPNDYSVELVVMRY